MKKLFFLLIMIILTTSCSKKSNIILTGDIQNNILSATSTVAGKIIKMNKQQGQPVKKGELIALIDNTNQKYVVNQLESTVKMKKAKLEELQLGTRPEQIIQAKAQVAASKAQLDLLMEGTRPEQIEQVRSQVAAAKAQLDLLESGNRNEQIDQARNSVSVANESVKSANISYEYLNLEYQKILNLNKEGGISQSELNSAKYKLDIAYKQLSTAKYQAQIAKKQLDLMQAGTASDSIKVAKFNYDSLKAQLRLLENGTSKQNIKAAQQNYIAAKAQLQLLQNGATTQSIQYAKADLEQSLAQLNQAKYNFKSCNVEALTDGIIISKNFEVGDVVNISSNIADIANSNDIYVLCYIPDEYLDKVYYNKPITVKTSLGEQTGKISFIALKHQYTPKDKQSTSEGNHVATKIKVAINSKNGRLKSGMKADIIVELK